MHKKRKIFFTFLLTNDEMYTKLMISNTTKV